MSSQQSLNPRTGILFRRLASWLPGLVCGIVLAVATDAVRAQGNPDEADALFRNLDSNKDGTLTSADGNASNQRMLDQVFRMAEKPASESLTRAEFQQVYEKHRANRRGGNPPPGGPGRDPAPGPPPATPSSSGLPAFLRPLDSNRDQRLTRQELGRIAQMFDRLDTDRDGFLDAAELQAAAADGTPPARDTDPTDADRPADRKADSTKPDRPAGEARRSGTAGRAGNAGTKLDGVWRGWVVDGRGENPNTGQMEVELTIEGNRVTGRELGTRRAPQGLGGGTFVMTGDETSGNLDADGTSGPQDGRHYLGIYELQADTLRWCVSPRRQRPQTMATDRGSYLMILRKRG